MFSAEMSKQLLKICLHLFCIIGCLSYSGPCTSLFAQTSDSSLYKSFDTLLINEVTIVAKSALRIKSDTVSFTVDSFCNNKSLSIDNILGRLPGVELLNDGTITVDGVLVTKLFINGRLYSGSDLYTMLLNLPVDVLEKIHIADWQDEDAQFIGIKKTATEKMINLDFKKQFQTGSTNKLSLGYGSKGRFNVNAFSSYLNSKIQIIQTLGTNNTGTGKKISSSGLLNTIPITGDNVINFLSTNISYENGNKKLTGRIELDKNRYKLTDWSKRINYLAYNDLITQDGRDSMERENQNISMFLRADYSMSNTDEIQAELGAVITANSVNMNSMDITAFNRQVDIEFQRELNRKDYSKKGQINFSGTYRKSFKKEGRGMIIKMGLGLNTEGRRLSNVILNEYLDPNEIQELKNHSHKNTEYSTAGANIQYGEPITPNSILQLSYRFDIKLNKDKREVFNIYNDIDYLDSPQSRSNVYMEQVHLIGALYNITFAHATLGVGFDISPYNRQIQEVSNQHMFSQPGTNYFPRLTFNYGRTQKTKFSLRYSGYTQAPQMMELYPVPDFLDSLNIYIGNPLLKPERSHSVHATLSHLNVNGKKNYWITLSAHSIQDKIIRTKEIDFSKQVTRPINTNGYSSLNLTNSISLTPFTATKVIFGGKLQYTNNLSVINGIVVKSPSYIIEPSLKVLYIPRNKKMDGQICYNIQFANLKINNNSVLNKLHNITANFSIGLPHGFWVYSNIKVVINEGLQSSNSNFAFLNATIEKYFGDNQYITLSFSVNDILNNSASISRTFGDNYYEDKSVNVLQRYFMLSAKVKFSNFR